VPKLWTPLQAKWQPVTVEEAWQNINNVYNNKNINNKIKKSIKIIPQGKSLGTIHPNGSYFNYVKLHLNKPSNTITKMANRQLFHPIEDRTLTSIELSRLGSFPDKFIFTNINNCSKGIGNSVPPLFMREIANHIKTNILDIINSKPVLVE
jgi:DNA (cytosine-5)-methyltransferase 1